jgi:hypothetical protein
MKSVPVTTSPQIPLGIMKELAFCLISKGPKQAFGNIPIDDCQAIEFIKCMRDAGVSIDSLIAYMDLLHQGDGTQQERKAILLKEKEKLQAHMNILKETIAKLDWKIAHYDILGKCHNKEK